jgi:Cys/Met metabolism PLP-dependent enzyme
MSWLPEHLPPPPTVMSLEDAIAWQERFIAIVARHFAPEPGLLEGGDLGMGDISRPLATRRCEDALAEVFGSEACVLVRGAGTGAMRLAIFACVPPGSRVLVHEPETYLTTKLTLEAMGVESLRCDFNSLGEISEAIRDEEVAAVLVQHMRPRVSDSYELEPLIEAIREAAASSVPIVVDDNYAPLKAKQLGISLGADLSAFSLFKLGAPEGIGCVLGAEERVERIRPYMNSGGSMVQGTEAIASLEALARAAPVTAHQSRVTREIAERLQAGEIEGIVSAVAAHCPETVVLVELVEPLAEDVREAACERGAVNRAVGMESYHEILPAFLRPSKSLIADFPGIEQHVIRISAMRAGADQVIETLADSLEAAGG